MLIEQLKSNLAAHSQFTWFQNHLRRKEKLVVGRVSQLRLDIIALWDSTPQGGHSRMKATLRRILTLFYSKGIREVVKLFVQKCDICQRNKAD